MLRRAARGGLRSVAECCGVLRSVAECCGVDVAVTHGYLPFQGTGWTSVLMMRESYRQAKPIPFVNLRAAADYTHSPVSAAAARARRQSRKWNSRSRRRSRSSSSKNSGRASRSSPRACVAGCAREQEQRSQPVAHCGRLARRPPLPSQGEPAGGLHGVGLSARHPHLVAAASSSISSAAGCRQLTIGDRQRARGPRHAPADSHLPGSDAGVLLPAARRPVRHHALDASFNASLSVLLVGSSVG